MTPNSTLCYNKLLLTITKKPYKVCLEKVYFVAIYQVMYLLFVPVHRCASVTLMAFDLGYTRN